MLRYPCFFPLFSINCDTRALDTVVESQAGHSLTFWFQIYLFILPLTGFCKTLQVFSGKYIFSNSSSIFSKAKKRWIQILQNIFLVLFIFPSSCFVAGREKRLIEERKILKNEVMKNKLKTVLMTP